MQTDTKKELPIGTISHGTHRECDFIPRFMAALKSVDPEREQKLREEYATELDAIKDGYTEVSGEGAEVDDLLERITYFTQEVIWEVMEEYAPADHYFGAHPGDGSDFGVWPIESED